MAQRRNITLETIKKWYSQIQHHNLDLNVTVPGLSILSIDTKVGKNQRVRGQFTTKRTTLKTAKGKDLSKKGIDSATRS